ncbi:hypothetical protein DJ68_15750, partial [Halorubrum sp. C3]
VVATTPIAPEVALAAAVLDHALKNGVTLAGGAAAAAAFDLSVTGASDETEREPEAGATRPTTDR